MKRIKLFEGFERPEHAKVKAGKIYTVPYTMTVEEIAGILASDLDGFDENNTIDAKQMIGLLNDTACVEFVKGYLKMIVGSTGEDVDYLQDEQAKLSKKILKRLDLIK